MTQFSTLTPSALGAYRTGLVIFLAVMLYLSVVGTAAAQSWTTEGDIVYNDTGFEGEACIEGYAVGVYLEMWSYPSHVFETDYAQEYNCAFVSTLADVHAQAFDVTLAAHKIVYWINPDSGEPYPVSEQYGDFVLPNAGPAQVHINIAAFLPYEYISVPADYVRDGYDMVAEGDWRGFGYDESARIRTEFSLWNSGIKNYDFLNWPDHTAGLSIDYHAESSLTNYPTTYCCPPDMWDGNAPHGGALRWEAQTDWEDGPPLKVRYAYSPFNESGCSGPERLGPEAGNPYTSQVRIQCWYRGWHAFSAPPAAPIEWGLDFMITYGNREAKIAVTGCATIFPACEMYAGGQSNSVSGEEDLFKRMDSGNVNHLFSGCSAGHFTAQGVVR